MSREGPNWHVTQKGATSWRMTMSEKTNKQRFAWIKKEKNAVKLQEVMFQKSLKLLTLQAWSSPQTKASQWLHNSPLK